MCIRDSEDKLDQALLHYPTDNLLIVDLKRQVASEKRVREGAVDGAEGSLRIVYLIGCRPLARREVLVNFYDRWVLPPLLDLVMRQHQLQKYRREVVTAASGRVLEIGVGSGLNFPLYGKQVEIVFGIDPSPRLLAIARRRAAAAGIRAEFLQGSATAIPLADNTVDTIVMTWTLCSIADPLAALREMRRVLKPDGKLLFVEHGLSAEPGIERWQHRLTCPYSKL